VGAGLINELHQKAKLSKLPHERHACLYLPVHWRIKINTGPNVGHLFYSGVWTHYMIGINS